MTETTLNRLLDDCVVLFTVITHMKFAAYPTDPIIEEGIGEIMDGLAKITHRLVRISSQTIDAD